MPHLWLPRSKTREGNNNVQGGGREKRAFAKKVTFDVGPPALFRYKTGTDRCSGEVEELGVDCVPGEMTELDVRYLTEKLGNYDMKAPNGVEKMQKYVSGKTLWNYDNLEPAEKKLIL